MIFSIKVAVMSRVHLNEELENALKYADIEIPSYIKDI